MLVMVSASMWMPLASRSPRAASETACWNRSRSVISSSIVRVPAIERSEPSRTFLTIVSIWLSGSPMKPLRGGAQPLGLPRDLEHRLAGDEDTNALLRDGRVLVRESDLDLTRR